LPTPAKTSPDALIGIALSLVEQGGADAVTIAAVAQAAGVKGPSLYKHFADREALLLATEIAVLRELEAMLRRETKGRTPKQRLRSLAKVYRHFATSVPHRYGMIYRGDVGASEELAAACLFSARPLFEELEAAGTKPKELLAVSRTLVAFLHGFVSMEIAQAFRLGGDLDEAFETGIETILERVG
jgi:AcrR family transcriptional regulator